MSDFIREVDEEYRRDRAVQLLSRYQVPIAVLVVAIIAGAGGYRFWADRQVANAAKVNDRYMAALNLARAGKAQEAEAAFDAIAKDGPAGYAMLARMRAAQVLQGHDGEAAAKAFDAIANDDSVPVSIRDGARLRGAMIRIDSEEPKAFEARYGRFSQSGFAFGASMRELLALAAFRRNDFEGAGRYLDQIIIDPNAPAAIRGRAQALRQLVGSGPAEASKGAAPPAAVKVIAGPPAPPPAPKPGATPPAGAPAPTTTPPAAGSPPTASPPAASPPAPVAAPPVASPPATAPAPAAPH